MITRKDLEGMKDGQYVDTVVLIKGYESKPTKNNSRFMDGTLEMKGVVQFKVWTGATYDELEKYEYEGKICHIQGKVNEFNGTKSLIINDIKAIEDGVYDESDFFEEVYNIEAYWGSFMEVVKKNTTAEGFKVFSMLIEKVQERFKLEFAAKGYHDAVRGGLLAHTYKVLIVMLRTVKLYPQILSKVDLDLLVVGTALHDIGKVYEYHNGAIVGAGLVLSHHTFGVEIIVPFKDEIIKYKGEDFYYRLLAIIEQHHGEFEETPRAVEAYLVHTADLLEYRFQAISEAIGRGDGVISIDGFKLK